ncbi:P-loop containing nucleoside triphosphate hydrolase protein [Coniella lustricola]|uniref:RNA helicase n=1 Tax=Coniella lustricola TaxID=2025994 RepID=A0A2T3AGG9_9PEZI|nr:P-loop containing nucleoside triphosphate hydrolase protein [Coniella lustricola]
MRWPLPNCTLATLHRPSIGLHRPPHFAAVRPPGSALVSYAALSRGMQKGKRPRSKEQGKKRGTAPGQEQGKKRGTAPGQEQGKKRGQEQSRQAAPKNRKFSQHAVRDNGVRAKPPAERALVLEFGQEAILSSMPFPTRKELPQMPKDVLTHPLSALQIALDCIGGTRETTTSKFVHEELNKSYLRAVTTLRLPDRDDIEVLGEGLSVAAAKKASGLHALAKLHAQGLLALPWAQTKLSAEDVKDERNGMIEIFNYAARYGCIPSYAFRRLRRGAIVHIEMPEHEIKVTVHTQGGLEHGEAAASREFKRQAELYHVKKGADLPAIDERAIVTASNAAQFFDFCRDVEDPAGFVEIKATQDEKNGGWGAHAVLDGKKLGTHVTVVSGGKKAAVNIAYLVAAMSVAKNNTELWEKFRNNLIAGNGNYLSKVQPKDLVLSTRSLTELRKLNQYAQRYQKRRQTSDGATEAQRHRSRRRPIFTQAQLAAKSTELKQKLETYQQSPELEQLRTKRYDLPMSQYAPQVREIVENNIYCVIIGATGSGKTTQVPQILLDQAIENGTGASCNVVCTQPRRIAATSVARRVAEERSERLQDTVGYQVRFDSKLPEPNGSIVYCTTGILLQQLQHEPDEVYDNVSHLVIDEVHERDTIIDFLLIILKKTMAQRAAEGKQVPKVILMSATIDADRFSKYFRNSIKTDLSADCPTLSVPGRTFPVKELYLENILSDLKDKYDPKELRLLTSEQQTAEYLAAEKTESNSAGDYVQDVVIDWKKKSATAADAMVDDPNDTLVPLGLVATTIGHIAKTTSEGAVLAFLPGLDEIVKTEKMLRDQPLLGVNFNDEERFRIFLLHSSIPDSQKSVFEPVPAGCRKIVLSTNIAETSVTIPDVQYVIDTGKSRETRYDQLRRITSLQCGWISKSNAKQRAGRAGRVQNGNYFALYTSSRAKSFRAIALPELLRSDLQEVCLDVMSQTFKMPVRDFLAEAIEPPSATAVDTAMRSLSELGAITPGEALTPLGRILASLPVHPSLGKMIVLGIIFKCLDPMIILGAAAAERSLFVKPLHARAQVDKVRKSFCKESESDHLTLLRAFRAARQTSMRNPGNVHYLFSENFIHHGAYRAIDSTARQIEEILKDAGLAETRDPRFALQYGGQELNRYSGSDELVKALLFAGLYPNIAINRKGPQFRTQTEKNTFIHPSSVISVDKKMLVSPRPLVTFSTLALSADGGRMNMREATVGSSLMPALLAGKAEVEGPIILLDKWLPFYVKAGRDDYTMNSRSQGSYVSRDILEFRQALDTMLENAFDSLVVRTRQVVDDDVRNTLADGLVKLLALDAERTMPQRHTLDYVQQDEKRRSPQEQMRFDLEQARNNGARDRPFMRGVSSWSPQPPSRWREGPPSRWSQPRPSQNGRVDGRAMWQNIVRTAQKESV